nr:MAG TPA: HOMING ENDONUCLEASE I-DMOI [Caudoviricetes sp.]
MREDVCKFLLSGSSRVFTDEGFRSLKDLEGEKVRVKTLLGRFEEVSIFKISLDDGVELYKLQTKLGNSLICSKNSVFIQAKPDYREGVPKLQPFSLLSIFKGDKIKFAKAESTCLESSNFYDGGEFETDPFVDGLNSKKNFKRNKSLEFFNNLYSVGDRLKWLEGLFTSGGNLVSRTERGKLYYTILLTGEEVFINYVSELLKTLGIQPRIRENKRGIIISHFYVSKLNDLGFRWRGETLSGLIKVSDRTEFDTILNVEKLKSEKKIMFYIETDNQNPTYVLVNDLPIKINKAN